MKIIAAVDSEWGIGRDGGLLLRIPEDMKNFKRLTLGKIVVMGHGTLRSLPGGRPLQGRTNIVLSHDSSLEVEGAAVCHSIEEMVDALKCYDTDDVYVIGGQSIFAALLPYCKTAYITKLETVLPADRFFPDLSQYGWTLAEVLGRSEYQGVDFTFTRYENPAVREGEQ